MTGTPIKQLIESFIESLAAEKGYSENTCRGYRNDLKEFINYLAQSRIQENQRPRFSEQIGIDEVDSISIRGYLGYLHKRNKKSTIARKLSAVRSFFKFLGNFGIGRLIIQWWKPLR